MRILAATKQQHGNAAVGKLYTTLGTWIHHDDDEHLTRLPEAIAAAGLPADIIERRVRGEVGRDHRGIDTQHVRHHRQGSRRPD